MLQENRPEADIRKTDKAYNVGLIRHLEATPEEVWKMLTDPDHLKDWLAPGTLDPRPGGAVQLDFGASGITIDSVIRVCDPPNELVYSWSSGEAPLRPLRWRLQPREGGTLLRLTVTLPENEDPVIAAAGWDAHLEMLMAALAGVPIGFPVQRFKEARSLFQA